MFKLSMLGAIAAVTALALPAVSTAQTVSSVSVEGRAPTEVRIALAGKPTVAVRQEVRAAAATVCRNAAANRELAFYDVDWCRGATQARALSRYATIVKQNRGQFAAGAPKTLTLAAR